MFRNTSSEYAFIEWKHETETEKVFTVIEWGLVIPVKCMGGSK